METKEKNRYFNIWTFLFLFIFFLISVFFLFLILPKSLLPGQTFEVYIQDGDYYHSNETEIDVFKRDDYNKKLVHPLNKGAYSFAIYNNSKEENLPYELEFIGENLDNIPLVFSLQKNGEYVLGGKETSEKVPLEEFVLENINLEDRTTDVYKLEWAWKTKSDEIDTFIGNIKEDQLFNLIIRAKGLSDIGRISKTDDNLYFQYVDIFKYLGLILLLILVLYIIHIITVIISNKIRKKPIKIISRNVVIIILIVLFIANIINIYKAIVHKEQISTVFGYGGALIVTGSMEPTINPGDLVIVKQQKEYHKGDIISYKGENTSTTHRIVGATETGFILTGDANNKEDGEISKDKVIGKVVKIIPGFMRVVEIVNSPVSIVILISVVYLIYKGTILIKRKIKKEEVEEDPDTIPMSRYLLYLLIITTLVSSFSFSKYKTVSPNDDGARVAKFDVEISHNEWSIDEYNDFALLDKGEEREFTFDIKNNGEVAVKFRVLNTADDTLLDRSLYNVYDSNYDLVTIDNNGWFVLGPVGESLDKVTLEGALGVSGPLNEIEFYIEYEQLR